MRERGFTFVLLLIAIALLGLSGSLFLTYWSEVQRRQNEEELFRIGAEFAAAIKRYYESSPGSVKQLPRSLHQLVEDDRFVGVRRHVRRIHVDPVTRTAEWGIVRGRDGGILGVHSLSEKPPLHRKGLPASVRVMGSGDRYSQLSFVYVPPGP
jgi:hypothetical protein